MANHRNIDDSTVARRAGDALGYILRCVRERHGFPAGRVIAARFGWGLANTTAVLDHLAAEGWLAKTRGTWQLTDHALRQWAGADAPLAAAVIRHHTTEQRALRAGRTAEAHQSGSHTRTLTQRSALVRTLAEPYLASMPERCPSWELLIALVDRETGWARREVTAALLAAGYHADASGDAAD